MVTRLEELNRDLAESATHTFPEDYVKKTLLAHGFFSHHQALEEHRRKLKEAQAASAAQSVSPKEGTGGAGITDEEKKRTTQLIYHYKEGKEFHSLKEPLSLIRYQKPIKSQTLWPAEVNCITYRCNYLWDYPASQEPLYIPENPVISPKIRTALGEGSTVYSNLPGPEKYFTKARPGPNISVPRYRQRQNGNNTLIFESKFESGNLARAIQVGRWDYELYLRYDLYTHKHTQWFYFSVQNMRAGQTYRFTIVNLYKPSSLYNEGMQPLFYSEKKAEQYCIGWRRVGFNIKYFKTDIRRIDTNSEQYYYALTWSYTFQLDNDICYFAHCYPYTYSDLQEYLCSIASDPVKSTICKQRTLCHTVAGNPVPILTITSASATPEDAQAKKAVVVTARVHPGETNSSWMMKGLIDFLTSDSPDAETLRDAFVFKIIPMLNPDGVIVGNYRCSLTGRDLNRNYRTKLRDAYPTVWHTKQFIKKLSMERTVVVYCDLHGHSRKQNVFIYGCDNIQDPSIRLRSRVFPIMLSKNAPNKFTYNSCNFKVQKTKEGTGRIFMWKEMGILNSYTMEATFCGSTLGKGDGFHFSIKELESMGYHFCDTLLDYCDPDQTKVERILNQLISDYRQHLLMKLAALGVEIPPGVDPLDVQFDSDVYSELESSDAGSDSSDSDGPPVHLLDKMKKKKHKKLQSRKERNRQKARIKLTHKLNQHSPQHYQLPSSPPLPIVQSSKKMTQGGVTVPFTTYETSTHHSVSTSSVNGGIPKFVLERLEEKSNKDSTTHRNEAASMMPQYIESVAANYVKHGLPQTVTMDANKELVTSMASLLSHHSIGDCPIAITPKVLQQPSQTKLGSKQHLPQLPQAIGSASGGAFARNYVVHHLQDEAPMDTGWSHDSTTSGNMRNLVSLSKLFRQLKPHLLGSLSQKDTAIHSSSQLSQPSTPKLSLRQELHSPAVLDSSQIMSKKAESSRKHHSLNKEVLSTQLSDNQSTTELKTATLVSKSSSTSSDGATNDVIYRHQSHELSLPASHYVSVQCGRGEEAKHSNNQADEIDNTESVLQLMQPPVTALELFESVNDEETQEYRPFDVINKSQSLPNQPMHESRQFQLIHKKETERPGEHKTNSHHQPLQSQRRENSASATHRRSYSSDLNTPSHMRSSNGSSGIVTYRKSSDHSFTSTTTSSTHKKHSNNHKHQIANAVENLRTRKKNKNHSTDNLRPQTSRSTVPLLRELKTTTSSVDHITEKRVKSGVAERRIWERPPSSEAEKARYRIYSSKWTGRQSASLESGGVVPSTVSLMLSAPSRPVSQHRPRPLQLRYYSNYKRGLF